MISILRVPWRNRNSWISVKSAGMPASEGTSLVSEIPFSPWQARQAASFSS